MSQELICKFCNALLTQENIAYEDNVEECLFVCKNDKCSCNKYYCRYDLSNNNKVVESIKFRINAKSIEIYNYFIDKRTSRTFLGKNYVNSLVIVSDDGQKFEKRFDFAINFSSKEDLENKIKTYMLLS